MFPATSLAITWIRAYPSRQWAATLFYLSLSGINPGLFYMIRQIGICKDNIFLKCSQHFECWESELDVAPTGRKKMPRANNPINYPFPFIPLSPQSA